MGGNNYSALKQKNIQRRDQCLKQQLKQVQTLKTQIGLDNEKIGAICKLSASELVSLLNNGELTSLEIVCAFCSRAGTIGMELKVITDPMFDKAIQFAKECDKTRKDSKKKNWTFEDEEYTPEKYLPPLFGIPISIKDSFDIEGYSSTIGLANRLEPKKSSSPIITCFRNSGVIPFTKTNMPQLGMTFQTMNDVWGRACNPWNTNRSTGGSSGGQSGLIASYCSPLGLGSDIGGSIRIPSEFCGLFSIKPTSFRLSGKYHTHFTNAFDGTSKGVPLINGPLARCVNDLALQLAVLYDKNLYQDEFDPYFPMVPFNQKQYNHSSKSQQKYKIGYVSRLRDIEPSKASQRALNETLDILKNQGHELFQIDIPNEREVLKDFFFMNLSTGAVHFRQMLDGQQAANEYKDLFKSSELWSPIRAVGAFAISKISPRLHYYYATNLGESKTIDFAKHLGRMSGYRKQWIKYWRENKLDFVVCPGFACQAVLHSFTKQTTFAASYTFLWNVFDTPTGSLPVTVVREDEQEYESEFNDLITNALKEIAKGSAGMPVGVQLIGFPGQQQKVLGLMKQLQSRIRFNEKHQPKI